MVGETSGISQSEGVYESGMHRNDGGVVNDENVDSDLHRKGGGLL